MSRGVAAFVAERTFAPGYLDEHPEAVDDTLLPLQQATALPTWLATLRAFVGCDLGTRLSDCHVPTLVLSGEHDRMLDLAPSGVDARRISELMPEAELRVIEGAVHFTTIEQPDEHGRAVIEFVATVGGGRPAGK